MGLAMDSTLASSFMKISSTSPRFCNAVSQGNFSDVAGDIMVFVDGQSFLLHKFPLASRSGKIRKLLVDSKDPDLSKLELFNIPGGPDAFELAVKFCYGMNLEITTSNFPFLRCVAEYLEMTEDYREQNLIACTEVFLNEIVLQSIEKSLLVLCACSSSLLLMAEEIGIINRCIEAVAMKASKEQLVSGLASLGCDGQSSKREMDYQGWWVEGLSMLNIDYYQRVIAAMRRTGVRSDSITASLIHYAQSCLKGIDKRRGWESGLSLGEKQRVVESIVGLLSTENIKSVPLTFLFGMLRMAIEVDASLNCKLELEGRIGFQLEMASLDDLLIPSLLSNESAFDVDTVHRIIINFLQRIEVEDSDKSSQCGYESENPNSPSHSSIPKVARLMDGYLAEIAPDPYINLEKFMALLEVLPDYARVIEDGLYRAVDIYLKAHPSLTEPDCKKLCKLINCQKLSQEASNHAAQNDRLPVQMTVRVLYFEQLRLKSAISGDSADGSFSQRNLSSSGVPSAAVSPRDNYASLRRENRELKLEITRMRVRLSELEKEHAFMKEGMRDAKSGENGNAFFASLSKGIGKIGIFGPGKQLKHGRKSQATDGKSRRRQRRSSVS
ncbi:Putative BTB/POZ domain-containing protein [Apostasia shenzhenica]|uniref:BTB/POZ domain-containing protein n=1 Tax=Apostasia shenzhenica TaxID=1088818 RepID=A0A2I0AXL6_9ASPA|nr:Putative BTB/POZ domain-containing protein [Apostasia shenzhenica]